jgi:hypothetical protein
MSNGEAMPSSGTSRDVEKPWILLVPSADATNLCMDSKDVAQAFCSPTTSRGCSHELSVDHISRAMETDTGEDMVAMSVKFSVDIGIESATSR